MLGWKPSIFPQTYLGLPMSPLKLRVSDFRPLLHNFDWYLSGCKAKMLNSGGQLMLVNVVFSGLPIYFMFAHLLPKTAIEALDARSRAFL
jgi:hypothetical protein